MFLEHALWPCDRVALHFVMILLNVLVVALESFLLSKKCINVQSNNSIKFVEAGAKLSKYTKKLLSGLLHLPADWKLLSDLGDKLVFPSFIDIIRLRPGIAVFSTSIKTAIILELTCPCKENMEWHQKIFFKYDPLTTSIRYNGWSVCFFAVKVGARGYCSTSLRSCLLCVGLPSKLVWPILKSLCLASLKTSFQIWQARDSKEWISITMDPAINVNLENDKQKKCKHL